MKINNFVLALFLLSISQALHPQKITIHIQNQSNLHLVLLLQKPEDTTQEENISLLKTRTYTRTFNSPMDLEKQSTFIWLKQEQGVFWHTGIQREFKTIYNAATKNPPLQNQDIIATVTIGELKSMRFQYKTNIEPAAPKK